MAIPPERGLTATISATNGSTVLVDNSVQCETDSSADPHAGSSRSIVEGGERIESSTAGSAEEEVETGPVPELGASTGSTGIHRDDATVNPSHARPSRCAAKGARKRIHDTSSLSVPRKKPNRNARTTEQCPTSRQLADAFGNEDVVNQIFTIKQQWKKVSRSRPLYNTSMHEVSGELVPGDRTTYLEALEWQGERLNRSTVEGQLYQLQNRINQANYRSLYNAAVEDTAKGKDSLFVQWTDEWMRQRGISFGKM